MFILLNPKTRMKKINSQLSIFILFGGMILMTPKNIAAQAADTTGVSKIMLEGIEYMRQNDYRKAIQTFDQGREMLHRIAVQRDEQNANFIESNKITREAEKLIDQGNMEGALELLNKAIELNDENIEAYKFRGSIRLLQEQQKPRKKDRDYIGLINDYTNAISIVNKRIEKTERRSQEKKELEKEKAKILINRAYVKMQSNRTPGFYSAIDDYNDAAQLDDQNWDAFLGRAVAYNKIREYRREVNDYLEAIELMQQYDYFLTDEEWANLYLNVAYAYANLKDKRNAFDYAVKSYNLGNLEAEDLMEKNRP